LNHGPPEYQVEAITTLVMFTLTNLTNTEVSSVDTLEQHDWLSVESEAGGIRKMPEKSGEMNTVKLNIVKFI
jgi:hypothetical protein